MRMNGDANKTDDILILGEFTVSWKNQTSTWTTTGYHDYKSESRPGQENSADLLEELSMMRKEVQRPRGGTKLGSSRASPKGLPVRMFREAGKKPKHRKPCRLRYDVQTLHRYRQQTVVTRGEGK